jgi:hypothetical protein
MGASVCRRKEAAMLHVDWIHAREQGRLCCVAWTQEDWYVAAELQAESPYMKLRVDVK